MRRRLAIIDRLSAVDAAAWDALSGADNPFIEHGFLAALEDSGCVGERGTGWVPRHLLVWEDDALVGAAPLYEKWDSYGEYIFDWGWARGAQEAGLAYYPKITSAVPFTPVTGRRLLVAPGADESAVIEELAAGVRAVAEDSDASSAHLLFTTAGEQQRLTDHGFLPRHSYQFHWRRDAAWSTFDEYLAALRSPVRKQIRRERRRAAEHGLRLSTRRGEELGDAEWEGLWRFYQDTTGRKWGSAYLNRDFFSRLRSQLAHRVVASFAHDGERPVAGALFFSKGQGLFGRYWGAERPLDCMHFELCYYQPIEWALSNGIHRFEAGAQGEHKLKRGLLADACYSSHWIREPALAHAIEHYLGRERDAVARELELFADHTPFKRR